MYELKLLSGGLAELFVVRCPLFEHCIVVFISAYKLSVLKKSLNYN